MNRLRARETNLRLDAVDLDHGLGPEERLPMPTAALAIIALSLFGWIAVVAGLRALLG
jgi:hypothetical protein